MILSESHINLAKSLTYSGEIKEEIIYKVFSCVLEDELKDMCQMLEELDS